MNSTIVKAVVALVLAAAIAGGYFFPKVIQNQLAGSAAGSTFGTAKVAEIVVAPITNAATSTSILNTDSSDRIVDSGFTSCATSSGSVTGNNPPATGLANWTWQFATTAVASQGLQGNTNYAVNMNVPTSTTDYSYAASSTNPAKLVNRTWASGTYMTFETNATTSNNLSEICQVGVYYHGS